MTTFLLVRHATCDHLGRSLAGRAPGVRLNEAGRREAERVAARLAAAGLDAIYSSPLERTMETATAIAARAGLRVEPVADLQEIDLGAWTGCTFEALRGDPEWGRWNSTRSLVRPPGGESMLEVQARAVAALERLRASHREDRVAVVSHSDVLRAAIAYYVGIALDLLLRIEVDPASVSTLVVTDWGARLAGLNDTGALCPT